MQILFTLVVLLSWKCTFQSGAVSDLALLTRAEKQHPAAVVKSTSTDGGIKVPPHVHSMVVKSESLLPELEMGAVVPSESLLSLWRVKIILMFLILAIVGALGVAVVYTARVFGWDTTAAEEPTKSVEDGSDSLSNLLHSSTMSRYASLFGTSGNKKSIILPS